MGDITIADALGLGNIQLIKPGSQNLDPNASMVLMALDVEATLVLPRIDEAVLSYPYRIRNVGTKPLIVTTQALEIFDRRADLTSQDELPPEGTVTIAAIEQDDKSREWVVVDFTFSTPSFPRIVSGAIIDTATVNLKLGQITTIGASVTLVNLPLDPPMGSSIGIRSDSGVTLNPTIDAGTGRTVQDIGGNLDYNQSNTLGLKKRESFIFGYCADSLQWSALSRPASP